MGDRPSSPPSHAFLCILCFLGSIIVTILIFDFDGTIADTFDTLLNITNRLVVDMGYPPFEPEEIRRLQNLSSREIVKQSHVSIFKLPLLLKRIKSELNREILTLQPIPGMAEALCDLNRAGKTLGVVTSNSPENVSAFLRYHGLVNLFAFTQSGTTVFGKHRVIRRILQQHQLNPKKVIYVGDETRDIEAARKIPIRVAAVSWGFNSRQILEHHQPDFLLDDPRQLLEINALTGEHRE